MERIEGKQVGEVVLKETLENGLRVFVMPKKGYGKGFATFTTNFGSNDLSFRKPGEKEFYQVPLGIAHFLEHKMFEEEDGNAFDRFSAYGANANAFTNFNVTSYYFTTTSHFQESLEQLIDFVQTPYFTEENVEKEKGIIAQEIKMYQDHPQWRVYFNFLKGMYQVHPVKNDIAGTLESIQGITKEALYHCYETFYHPGNMVLFVAGDFQPETIFEQVSNYFQRHQTSKYEPVERKGVVEPEEIASPEIEERLSVSIPLFHLGYKDTKLVSDGRKLMEKEAVMRLLMDLIFGKSSQLYERLYEKGLINQEFMGDYVGELDYGYTIVSGESKNPREIKKYVDEAMINYQQKGIPEDDFQRIKRKQIGENLSAFNSIEYVGNSFVSYYLRKSNFLEFIPILKEVQLEEANRVLNSHFQQSRQVLSIIQPN